MMSNAPVAHLLILVISGCSASYMREGLDIGPRSQEGATEVPDGGTRRGTDKADPVLDADVADAFVDEFASGCESQSDCQLVPHGCCIPCGPPSLADYQSVLAASQVEAIKKVGCEGVTCMGCGGIPWPNEMFAGCEDNTCTVIDLRERPDLTRCEVHGDCHVRAKHCCECDSGFERGALVGVSDVSGLQAALCGGALTCDTCTPDYPPEVLALCMDGHCSAVDPR